MPRFHTTAQFLQSDIVTKALTQTPTSPPAPLPWGEGSMLHKKQKAITQPPTSPQAPLPWGEGSMLHKKQKAITQTHKKAPLPQHPKPHHLMKCERAARHRRVALSHFGGCGGTSSPHKKNYFNMCSSTSTASATTPISACSKIGAFLSVLIATMHLACRIPARCWIAPDTPNAT